MSGYLMTVGEKPNEFFYKLNQMPRNWFYKSFRLYTDASMLFACFEKERKKLLKGLKKKGFNGHILHRDFEIILYNVIEEESIYPPDYRSFYLLASFCLENAIKGLIVSENLNLINAEKLDIKLKSHNLTELVKELQISINKDELTLLKKLSQLAISYGRYPIPSKVSMQKSIYDFDDGDIGFLEIGINCVGDIYNEDFSLFKHLYNKLKILMKKADKEEEKYMLQVFNAEN